MYKIFLGLVFYISTLLGNDFLEYKTALQKENYTKVFEIYQKYFDQKDIEKYRLSYFNTIVKQLHANPKKAQMLINKINQFEYDDKYLQFIQAQLYYKTNKNIQAIELLYKLESGYLDGDLRIDVKKNLDRLINNYLVSLYNQKDCETIQGLVELFNKHNDRKSRDLWIAIMLQCANDMVQQKAYGDAMGYLEIVKPYYLNLKNKKNYKIIVNNIGISYLEELYKSHNLEQLNTLIAFLKEESSSNLYFAKKLLRTIKEKENMAKIGTLKIPLVKKNKQYYVDGYINGKRTHFLLDTGATTTMVNRSLIGGLEYDIVQKDMRIYTALGSGKADLVAVDRLSINYITLDFFEIIVSKRDVFSGHDGLLGMDFLDKFDFRIDQKNNQLILSGKE